MLVPSKRDRDDILAAAFGNAPERKRGRDPGIAQKRAKYTAIERARPLPEPKISRRAGSTPSTSKTAVLRASLSPRPGRSAPNVATYKEKPSSTVDLASNDELSYMSEATRFTAQKSGWSLAQAATLVFISLAIFSSLVIYIIGPYFVLGVFGTSSTRYRYFIYTYLAEFDSSVVRYCRCC